TPSVPSIRRVVLAEPAATYTFSLKNAAGDHTAILNHPKIEALDENFFTALGITFGVPAVIGEVMVDSPAAHAGLQRNDKVLAIGDNHVASWIDFVKQLGDYPNKTTTLTLERAGQTLHLPITPLVKMEQGHPHAYIGVKVNEEWLRVSREDVGSALVHGFSDTWFYTGLTFVSIAQMFTGSDWDQVSGPITIAIYAGKTAQQGFTYFLQFLALISISLGVINLLPIPMLDGGHLLYYVLELVRRKPLSLQAQQIGLALGLVVLVLLMTLAFYNDVVMLGTK
ncbi:MAG TPA: RIP metalloprotease RseP, partial [Gammaproteobacteria bacterium]|nr:RIP metalloprotease RseP [Gammaproteobacteria bacterium]